MAFPKAVSHCLKRLTYGVISVTGILFLTAAAANAQSTVTVTAPTLVKQGGTTFTAAIALSDPSNAGVASYQFQLDYDPTVINPSGANSGCSNAGTLTGVANQAVNCNTAATADPHVSTLFVSDFGAAATSGSGTLLDVTFTATNTGPFPKTSPLHFHDALFFSLTGPLTVNTQDGSVQISLSTAANVTVSGRVTDARGNGVRGARVTLAGTGGPTLTAVSNPFGYYRFQSVESGVAYTVTAAARGLTFAPRVVSVTRAIADLDLTAR